MSRLPPLPDFAHASLAHSDFSQVERTPPRDGRPPGSVVDPPEQAESRTVDSRHSRPPSRGPRRKPEATLVLAGRRVDALREQIRQRDEAVRRSRRWQIVLWALSGALAVLLGGFLAKSFSSSAGTNETPFVLGRSSTGELEPPPPVEGGEVAPAGESAASASAATYAATEQTRSSLGVARAGLTTLDASRPEEHSRATSSSKDAARRPGDPKVPGDWGDGFEKHRSARPAPGSSKHALSLDELPTE